VGIGREGRLKQESRDFAPGFLSFIPKRSTLSILPQCWRSRINSHYKTSLNVALDLHATSRGLVVVGDDSTRVAPTIITSLNIRFDLQASSSRLVVLHLGSTNFHTRFDFHGYFLLSFKNMKFKWQ
jgi:hypothetical protein